MKDYSHLNKKALFLHRTDMQDEGKWHEYFFGLLEATKSVVTAYTEITPSVANTSYSKIGSSNCFKENAAKKEFEVGIKKVVPDYTVHHIVDLRTKKA